MMWKQKSARIRYVRSLSGACWKSGFMIIKIRGEKNRKLLTASTKIEQSGFLFFVTSGWILEYYIEDDVRQWGSWTFPKLLTFNYKQHT